MQCAGELLVERREAFVVMVLLAEDGGCGRTGKCCCCFATIPSQLPLEQIQSNSCQQTLQCVCQTGVLLAASRSAGVVMALLVEDSGCRGCWKFCCNLAKIRSRFVVEQIQPNWCQWTLQCMQ